MTDIDKLRERLTDALQYLEAAQLAKQRAERKSDTAHEMGGGIPGFGGSGNQRAARQVRTAWESVNWQVPEWEPDRIPFDKVHAVRMPEVAA